MPTGKHSNWTHLCVFLGLDIGFDARRRSASHAALVDGVLADWGRRRRKNAIEDFQLRKDGTQRRQKNRLFMQLQDIHWGLSNVLLKAVLKVLPIFCEKTASVTTGSDVISPLNRHYKWLSFS